MGEFIRPYFHFNPTDIKARDFASVLAGNFENYDSDECDVIVDVGGDGTIYHSFHNLPNKPNFSLKPPNSTSTLFNGHENIHNGENLRTALSGAFEQAVHPLRATIILSDGSRKDVYAYVDIHIRSDNAQATLIQETINGLLTMGKPVMGSGWIIATPLGSTALNETRGGDVIALASSNIVRTMNGVSNVYQRQELQKANLISKVVNDDAVIDVLVAPNHEKRATKVDFDSWSVLPDGGDQGSNAVSYDTSLRHIVKVTVQMDKTPERTRTLLLNKKYRTPNPF